MTDNSEDSIRGILGKIRERDQSAVQEVWDAYFAMLTRIADRQLATGVRRAVDGEDVALSVMRSICRRAETGELDGVSDRDGLWALMLTLLYHKAADQGRRHRAAKRGGGNVRGESVFLTPGSETEQAAFAQCASETPTPELLVELDDERQRMFDQLEDDQLREIARRRLDGESVEEIADLLNISPRTVRRKLELIRASWAQSVEGLEPAEP